MGLRNRRMTWAAALAAALVAGAAVAEIGSGINIGRLRLSPYANIAGTLDSNPRLVREGDDTSNDDSDTYYNLGYGINAVYNADRIVLAGAVWGRNRRYTDITSQDSDDFGEYAQVTFLSKRQWSLSISEAYSALTDYEPDMADSLLDPSVYLPRDVYQVRNRNQRTERSTWSVGGSVGGPITHKLGLQLGYQHAETDYDVDYLYGDQSDSGNGTLSFNLSEKTQLLLSGDLSQFENEVDPDASQSYAIRAGLGRITSIKTYVSATFGYTAFNAGNSTTNLENSSRSDGLSFQIRGDWQATTKTRLFVSAHNGYEASNDIQNNARLVNLASIGLNHQISTRLSLGLSGAYRLEYYLGEVMDPETGEMAERSVEQVGGYARADYLLTKWSRLFIAGSYENTDDDLAGEYNQGRVSLGVSVWY